MFKINSIILFLLFMIGYSFKPFFQKTSWVGSFSKFDFFFGKNQEAPESLPSDRLPFNREEIQAQIASYFKQEQSLRVIQQIIIEESRENDIIRITIQMKKDLLKKKLSQSYKLLFKEEQSLIFPESQGPYVFVEHQDIKNTIKQVMSEYILSGMPLKEIEYLITNKKFFFLNSKESPQEQLLRWKKLIGRSSDLKAYHLEGLSSEPYKKGGLIQAIGYSLLKSADTTEESFRIEMTKEQYLNRFKQIIKEDIFDMLFIFPKAPKQEAPKQEASFFIYENSNWIDLFHRSSPLKSILLAGGGSRKKELIQPESPEEIQQEISHFMNLNDGQFLFIQLNLSKEKFRKWVCLQRLK